MRGRLSLRARLALLCLGLAALTGGLFAVAMDVLISVRLVQLYSRPPVILDLDSPTPTEDLLAARRAANDDADRVAGELRVQSWTVFGVMVVGAAGLCWFVAGRALRPVRRITATASRLSQDTLDDRIRLAGPRDELWVLAESFDAMLDRLARAFDAQRLFVANASHELRTPLTVIRTASEVALARPDRPAADYRRALETITRAVGRSEGLLDSLLRLARTQHRRGRPDRVDLADLARAALPPDPAWPVTVRADLAPAPVAGDANLLDLLIRNLVGNAVAYNTVDGWIAVRTGVRGDDAVLEVENTGPPVAADEVPDLLRPFRRGGQARTGPGEGSGLGLALVDGITHVHDGRLDLTARPDGGLLVTVTLPGS